LLDSVFTNVSRKPAAGHSGENRCPIHKIRGLNRPLSIEPGADQTIRIAVEKSENLSKECWDILFVQQVAQ